MYESLVGGKLNSILSFNFKYCCLSLLCRQKIYVIGLKLPDFGTLVLGLEFLLKTRF